MRCLVLGCVVACALLAPATRTEATAPPAPPGVGIKLLEGPANGIDDPRAHSYVVDHLAPGTTISRKLGISNGGQTALDVDLYPAAATISGGVFVVAEGHTSNELASWISFSVERATIAPGETMPVTMTIVVPPGASAGERYAVALAEAKSASTTGVTLVSRVGVRVYLSVGPGGEPRTAFSIESLTASRDPSGQPVVAAIVHNTGERAVDLSGSLQLSNGPGSLSAGPFPVRITATLAPGDSGDVYVALDQQLPDGPWKATLSLTSGLTTETSSAQITFPSGTGEAAPSSATPSAQQPRKDHGRPALVLVGAAAAVALTTATIVGVRRRRRRR
ncbi:MAG: hypothetical protein JWM12_1097 [Ilumatobacteraceae bacterium]|nr:hypothetical protein [Ilumatobacteraceae bacterium]